MKLFTIPKPSLTIELIFSKKYLFKITRPPLVVGVPKMHHPRSPRYYKRAQKNFTIQKFEFTTTQHSTNWPFVLDFIGVFEFKVKQTLYEFTIQLAYTRLSLERKNSSARRAGGPSRTHKPADLLHCDAIGRTVANGEPTWSGAFQNDANLCSDPSSASFCINNFT